MSVDLKITRALVVVWLALGASLLHAQTYPQRPVRLVVAVAAGGSTDIMARLIGAKLGERIGQQVVVDNRPGGSSIIGSDIVAKAQPDGHTLLMASGSFGTVSSLFKKLPFDIEKDLAPICLLATSPYVLVVQPTLPIKSVADLISYGKANPGKLNYAGSTFLTTQPIRRAPNGEPRQIELRGFHARVVATAGGRVAQTHCGL